MNELSVMARDLELYNKSKNFNTRARSMLTSEQALAQSFPYRHGQESQRQSDELHGLTFGPKDSQSSRLRLGGQAI